MEEAFVTVGLYLTGIERYFHPANFCFCSPMSTKLWASIYDDTFVFEISAFLLFPAILKLYAR